MFRCGLVAATLMLLGTRLLADSGLSGVWSGTYSCANLQRAAFTLEITDPGTGVLDGVFSFDANGVQGSYSILGRSEADGRFRLVPRDWIKRPAGYSALGLEGRANPNGRLIEGNFDQCGFSNEFKATREPLASGPEAASLPAAPLTMAAPSGLWRGAIACTARRRGKTELYPVTAQIFEDAGFVGMSARIEIFQTFGAGAGPVFAQQVLLSGQRTASGIATDRAITIDHGGSRGLFKGFSATLDDTGTRIEGTVTMKGCNTLSLAREGDAEAVSSSAALRGQWIGGGDTAVVIDVLQGSPPFAELRATWPADLPEPERDRLRLSLVPVHERNGRMVYLPVGFREATGVMAGERSKYHPFAKARALVLAALPSGTLSLRLLSNENDAVLILDAPADAPLPDSRYQFELSRPSAETADAVAAGETPPVSLPPAIGGSIAAAASREAQCRTMAEWLAPYARGIELGALSIDVARTQIGAAFADSAFEPVFGLPFILLSDAERRPLSDLILGTCRRIGDEMDPVSFVGDHVFSPGGFAATSTMITNRKEAASWLALAETEVAGLPDVRSSVDRIEALREELAARSADFGAGDLAGFRSALDSKIRGITAAELRREAEALAPGDLASGALDAVFRFMVRLGRADVDPAARAQLAARAEATARQIVDPVLKMASDEAATLPPTLDGLAQARQIEMRLQPALVGMADLFQFEPSAQIAVLQDRKREIMASHSVLASFEKLMLELETPEGVDPADQVRDAAARFISPDEAKQHPAYEDVVNRAINLAELRSVQLTDLSPGVPASPGEPTVEEIAGFALERVRSANAGTAETEAACLSGQITDAVMAIQCLMTPGVITGQGGFGARLLAVTKLGCTEEKPRVQFLCSFAQRITFNVPGGEAFGGDRLAAMAADLSGREVVDARFMRADGGGLTVIWGDLD